MQTLFIPTTAITDFGPNVIAATRFAGSATVNMELDSLMTDRKKEEKVLRNTKIEEYIFSINQSADENYSKQIGQQPYFAQHQRCTIS